MNKNLLILGAGQYGLLVKEIAELTHSFAKISFLDDANPAAVGKLSDSTRFFGEYHYAIVAMGNPQLRLSVLEQLEQDGFQIPVLCHPSAVVMPSAKIGSGCILEAMAVINSNACVEKGCLVSAGAVINHNAHLEAGCHIDCNAVVPARSLVPAGTKVPCGSVYEK